jgi:uncharacterized membrane protein YgcG
MVMRLQDDHCASEHMPMINAGSRCLKTVSTAADGRVSGRCSFLSPFAFCLLFQAKQTPVAQMRAAGKQQSRNIAQNRASAGRQQQLQARRAANRQQQASSAPPALPAGARQVIVVMDAQGRPISQQPVTIVQQPGQAAPSVFATGAAQSAAPLFKVANRQARQGGGAQQQQSQPRRQGGGGGNGGRQGGRRN